MSLDIGPLRSFVAIDDCGGFQRAARSLQLSQSAISQHVRRLEAAVDRPLVVRHGRGSRFTPDGERLLTHARRILAVHDEALHAFGVEAERVLVIGSTEHAATQLLPCLSGALGASTRFRIDRGTRLRAALAAGAIDLALLLGPADEPRSVPVGELELTWYAAPTWTPPAPGRPIPLAAFDDPCALRTRALETLAEAGVPAVISAESAQLAGCTPRSAPAWAWHCWPRSVRPRKVSRRVSTSRRRGRSRCTSGSGRASQPSSCERPRARSRA